MHTKDLYTILSLIIPISGCAVHPLPEDVTGLSTPAIVNHIRCEARDSITAAVGSYLSIQKDEASKGYGLDLLDKRIIFSQVDLGKLNSNARYNIQKYLPAAIAYDFTFDITETNEIGSQVEFLNTFTRGIFGLGINVDNNRQRETIRNFRITDTFGDLLGPVEAKYCDDEVAGVNWSYPVAGTIGLAEVVRTFVDLNEFQHLSSAASAKDNVPVLADTFNFSTTLTGSTTPKVVLSPLKSGFQLLDASITATGSRKDIHKVIVALSLPPSKPVAANSLAAAQIVGPAFRLTSLPFNKTPAEQIAIAEIYNQLERNILFNLVVRPN
jgi:hypothetical protein